MAWTTNAWSATIIRRFILPPPWAPNGPAAPRRESRPAACSPPALSPPSAPRECSCEPLWAREIELAEPRVQPGHELDDLIALGHPQVAEEPSGLRVTVLGGLELEDAIARPQLKVEGQRAEEILEGLIDPHVVSQVPQAVRRSVVTS